MKFLLQTFTSKSYGYVPLDSYLLWYLDNFDGMPGAGMTMDDPGVGVPSGTPVSSAMTPGTPNAKRMENDGTP